LLVMFLCLAGCSGGNDPVNEGLDRPKAPPQPKKQPDKAAALPRMAPSVS
jgi:hypothetical protein